MLPASSVAAAAEFHYFPDLLPELQCLIVLHHCDAATRHAYFYTHRAAWYGDGEGAAIPRPCYARDKHPPSSVARAIVRGGYVALVGEFRAYNRFWVPIHNLELDVAVLHDTYHLFQQRFRVDAPDPWTKSVMAAAGVTNPDTPEDMAFSTWFKIPFHEVSTGEVNIERSAARFHGAQYYDSALAAIVLRPDVDKVIRTRNVTNFIVQFADHNCISVVLTALAIGRPDLLPRFFTSLNPFAVAGQPLMLFADLDATGTSLRWLREHYPAIAASSYVYDPMALRSDTEKFSRCLGWIAYATRNERFVPSRLVVPGDVLPPTSPEFVSMLTGAMDHGSWSTHKAFRAYVSAAVQQGRAEYVSGAYDVLIANIDRLDMQSSLDLLFLLLDVNNVRTAQRAALIASRCANADQAYDHLCLVLRTRDVAYKFRTRTVLRGGPASNDSAYSFVDTGDTTPQSPYYLFVHHLLARPDVVAVLRADTTFRWAIAWPSRSDPAECYVFEMAARCFLDGMMSAEEALARLDACPALAWHKDFYAMAREYCYGARE